MHLLMPTKFARITASIFLYSIIFVIFTSSAVSLFDLSDGRFGLFMDEKISFDGISAIYHSNSLKDFLKNIAYGFDGDLRYGRGFWNVTALISSPFYLVWGAKGQIIATRLVGLFAMTASYFLLARLAIPNKYVRLISVATLLIVSTHLHYMAMPKPEPLLLLFVAIFFTVFAHYKYRLNASFIFLGFAWGLKVSIAPLIVLFVAISLIKNPPRRGGLMRYLSTMFLAIGSILLGWIICSPIMIAATWPYLLGITGIYFLIRGEIKFLKFSIALPTKYSTYLGIALLLIESALISMMSLGVGIGAGLRNAFETISDSWFNWVVSQAGTSGATPDSIFSWTELASKEYGGSLKFYTYGVLLVSAFVLFLFFTRRKHATNQAQYFFENAAALLVGGLLLNISIILSVNRFWGFYLHPGTVLMITGIIGLLSILGSVKTFEGSPVQSIAIAIGSIFTIVVLVCGFWFLNFPKAIDTIRQLGIRTSSSGYQASYLDYLAVIERVEIISKETSGTVSVAYDPFLFIPDNSTKAAYTPIWSGIVHWDQNYDVFFFSSNDKDSIINSLSSPEIAKNHISTDEMSGKCAELPCYRFVDALPSGGVILEQIR